MRTFCAFLVVLTSTYVNAQALITLAPFGKPAAVMDESGNWSAAIQIYSDADLEAFVPDITSAAWILWHRGEFLKDGTYAVYLYSHYLAKNYWCRPGLTAHSATDKQWLAMCPSIRYQRRLISVDTRQKTVTVLESALMMSDAVFVPEWRVSGHETIPLT